MNNLYPSIPMSSSYSGSPRLTTSSVPKVNLLNIAIFSLAAIVNIYSYFSFTPFVVTVLFYAVSYTLLVLTPLGGAPERRMFNRVFSVGFLMAGIAAIYANQFEDAGQLYSDAAGFFDLAAGNSTGMTLIEIQVIHEGALGIILWRAVYDFFALLGFEKARYIGISVNVTLVALSGVIGIKLVRKIFGNDDYRFRRLTMLVAASGLFWLFAGTHLRDSAVLLAVTSLVYAWVYFLTKPDLGFRLVSLVSWCLLAAAFLGFLRGEFVFVPFALAVAAIVALLMGRKERRGRWVPYVLMIFGGAVIIIFAGAYVPEINMVWDRGQTGYSELAAEQHSADSLGMSLIVNQPTPIRLVLGSIYLFVFPIPFWSGFQLESAYALFKSANAIYFYFVLPLLLISLRELKQNKVLRKPALLFLVFVSFGFTLAIAGTSLETRHFGAFLLPIFLLATVPDLRVPRQWHEYKGLVSVVLAGVFLVHLTWFILKFL